MTKKLKVKKSGFAQAKTFTRIKTVKEYGAYDLERIYITNLLESGNFMDALLARMDATWFSGEDTRRYFSWILAQFEKHGKPPSIERFETTFKDFIALKTTDVHSELIGELRDKKMYQELSVFMAQTKDKMRDDPAGATQGLSERITSLLGRLSETSFASVSIDVEEMKAEYEETEELKGQRGIPWPWPILNEFSPGILESQYYVLYGNQGVMKTFLAIFLVVWLLKRIDKVGLISMEMSRAEMRKRYAAQRAGLDYGLVESAGLSPKQKKAYFKALDAIRDGGTENNLFIADPTSSGDECVAEIDALMAQNPDIKVWIIDGLGMIPKDSSWEANLELQKKVKRVARRRKTSVIAMHHANQVEVKEDDQNNAADVAGGAGVPRYVDGLIRLRRTDLNREQSEVDVGVVKMRNGDDCIRFTIHAKPGESFEQKGVLKRPKPRSEREETSSDDDDDAEL